MNKINIPEQTRQRMMSIQQAIASLTEQFNAIATTLLELNSIPQNEMKRWVVSEDFGALVRKDETTI